MVLAEGERVDQIENETVSPRPLTREGVFTDMNEIKEEEPRLIINPYAMRGSLNIIQRKNNMMNILKGN